MRGLALVLVLALAAGCFAPPAPPAPVAGEFHLKLLGASPSATAMRWNVVLSNGAAAPLKDVTVKITLKFYRTRDAGQDQKTVDVPASNTTVVLLSTPYMGFGDYDYTLQALDAEGNVLDGDSGLYELCLC